MRPTNPETPTTLSAPRSAAALFASADTLPGKAVLAVGASVLVAVAAHVALPLPFTPVPIFLGDLAVLTLGVTLGPATAFSALMLYLLEGAAGLPVFAPNGPGGMLQLLGATGGYLFAYPLVAFTAGIVARALSSRTSRFLAGAAGAALASVLLFTIGTLWLGTVMHLSAGKAIALAVLPFLFGNLAKITAAASIYSATQRWRQQRA